MRVVSPLQSGAARAIKPFRDGLNWFGNLFSAQSQNRSLRTQVQQLRSQLAQQLVVQQQDTELKGLVKMRDSSVFPKGARFAQARVIARSTTAWYSTITIDAGTAQGVRLNDAVVNGQGLVGRVSAVTPEASEVTLIVDQDSFVDAKVVASGASSAPGPRGRQRHRRRDPAVRRPLREGRGRPGRGDERHEGLDLHRAASPSARSRPSPSRTSSSTRASPSRPASTFTRSTW